MIQKPIYNNSLSNGYGNNNIKSINTNTENDSRLINNTEELRSDILSRNLYNPFQQYPIPVNTRQQIANIAGGVANILMPFKSFNFSNSIAGRLFTLPNTPLVDIGMVMLAKQMGYNVASNTLQAVLPQLNLNNLFNGGRKTKKAGFEDTNAAINSENDIIALPKNFKITRSLVDSKFRKGLETIFGTQFTTINPFKRGSSNDDYLDNTGKQQIGYLYGQLSKNMFKPYDSQSYKERFGFVISNRDKNIYNKDEDFLDDKVWFDFYNLKFNPYSSQYYNVDLNTVQDMVDANQNMINAYQRDTVQNYTYFYGGTYEYIIDMGETKSLPENTQIIDETSNSDGFNDDTINNRLIWGEDFGNSYNKFGVQHGLLEYTRNLVKATGEKHIGLNKYGYKDDKGNYYYNGSRLIKAPDYSMFNGEKWVRQHQVLDQYNRYSKAIRYDGNNYYNGNSNSVVFDSVMPQITPKFNKNLQKIDTKRLMFSIENLAIDVIPHDKEGFGIVDDGNDTVIPLCEVSENRHRIMWFPPYDIKYNETSNANYNDIKFLGRVEPIYTYINSERSGNLTFKMLIDHPPQIRKGATHKEYADFFAFGGIMKNKKKAYKNNPKKLVENNQTIKDNSNQADIKIPEKKAKTAHIFFPNDEPKTNDILYIMDRMYYILKYEPVVNKKCVNGSMSNGLNSWVYYTGSGDTKTIINLPTGEFDIDNSDPIITNPDFSQYTHPYDPSTDIDEMLNYYFNDEQYNKYFTIKITGKATKLYTEGNPNDIQKEFDYNKALGLRRAEAAKYYIEERIKVIFGKSAEKLGITFEVDSIGSIFSDPGLATAAKINDPAAKMERSVEVVFARNSIVPENKPIPTNTVEKEIVNNAQNENEILNSTNKDIFGCVYDDRNDEISKDSFSYLKNNNFAHSFHSQTPEDFHNRLTFLQQCLRPGKPIQGYGIGCDAESKNSSFGKPPVCVMRIADFLFSKIIIDSMTINYSDTTWDTNPEGFGMQPMIAEVTLQFKIIGGQSLQGAIDQLQNAISYNYYANSDFNNIGVHKTATDASNTQLEYNQQKLIKNKK